MRVAIRTRCSRIGAGALRRCALALFALHAALGAAADRNAADDIEARYQSERAACNAAAAGQDRATCLREAAAARAAARQGQLSTPQDDLEKNALARCDALPPQERDLCRRRTRDQGVTKGSVTEGGIYREYREITLPPVAPQPGAAPGNSPGEPPAAASPQSR